MAEQLHSVSDDDGYRPNVGIVLFNSTGQVLWARRSRHDGWQFPQGGIEQGESVEQAATVNCMRRSAYAHRTWS